MSSVSPSMTTIFTVVEPTSTPIHSSSYFFAAFAFSVNPDMSLLVQSCNVCFCVLSVEALMRLEVVRYLAAHLFRDVDRKIRRGADHAFVLGNLVHGL